MAKYLPFDAKPQIAIYSLLSEYQWLNLLKNRNKPYEVLLDYFIQIGQFESEKETNRNEYARKVSKLSENSILVVARSRNGYFKFTMIFLK